jgi:hypothetical protein
MLSISREPCMLRVFMLNVVMLSVIMLSVAMLNVVMLSVAALEGGTALTNILYLG